ncbi:hypothetical protein EPD60_03170 [Flaviaesturariibacter flavus]|uniref:Uncharacterized protein n=1 Tax=Flaviaesturariibacter flavus TaxID=2502780 RepID=A0A4R1BN55_9BACT|nr:hypothetical protein [Flaviaesturariibacter flavus]TCJ18775.1 hypothetical protein EPD60_03170 [Flaviaesturariibacter flavus]
MNLQKSRLQPDFEFGYFSETEPDVRREPNYILLLLLIILGLFAVAMAVIFISHGQLPIFE